LFTFIFASDKCLHGSVGLKTKQRKKKQKQQEKQKNSHFNPLKNGHVLKNNMA